MQKRPPKVQIQERNLRQRSPNYQGARPKAETRICEKAKKRAEKQLTAPVKAEGLRKTAEKNPRQTFLSAFTKMTVTKWHIQKFGQQSLEKKLR